MNCKYCGKEIEKSEFDAIFTEEALENLFCSDECKQSHLTSKTIKIAGLTHGQDCTCPKCGKPTKADLLYDPYWAITPNQEFDPLMITCIDCKIKESEVF
ncbi:MAG: hypothetical protein GXY86_15845 [Firmicutes bacterium]|nr:hypothetical protein [Bacillota bacterium]